MADKLLEIKGVSKIFRVGGMIRGKKLVAVDDVTLSIDNDKPVILSVVGESGCGKSTLCKMVLRLHNPDMGDIVLDGQSYRDKMCIRDRVHVADIGVRAGATVDETRTERIAVRLWRLCGIREILRLRCV